MYLVYLISHFVMIGVMLEGKVNVNRTLLA